MNILIAPVEISGQYRNLALAINDLGIRCDYYMFFPHSFSYGNDIGKCPLPKYMRSAYSSSKKCIGIERYSLILLFEALRFVFFVRALFIYDSFIFGFGQSLLRYNLDLFILRLFGKKIVANMAHGSEMRPDYLDGALKNEANQMPPLPLLEKRASKKIFTIRMFECFSTYLIGSPLSSSFYATKPYLNIFALGRLCQSHFQAVVAVEDSKLHPVSQGTIRILHVPSHAPGKGSNEIIEIVNRLIKKGFPIAFTCLSGVTNQRVIAAIQECDLVVDQLYSDLPMSGLAAEAAYFGKPVVVAGYGLFSAKQFTQPQFWPPTIVTMPERLEATLERLLLDQRLMEKCSKLSHVFMREYYSPSAVASRYLHLLRGSNVPNNWLHDPRSWYYQYGYGLSSMECKAMIRAVLNQFGVRGLHLSHNPDLESFVIDFASSKD